MWVNELRFINDLQLVIDAAALIEFCRCIYSHTPNLYLPTVADIMVCDCTANIACKKLLSSSGIV